MVFRDNVASIAQRERARRDVYEHVNLNTPLSENFTKRQYRELFFCTTDLPDGEPYLSLTKDMADVAAGRAAFEGTESHELGFELRDLQDAFRHTMNDYHRERHRQEDDLRDKMTNYEAVPQGSTTALFYTPQSRADSIRARQALARWKLSN